MAVLPGYRVAALFHLRRSSHKTVTDMYASRLPFVNARGAARLLALGGGGALLAGCMSAAIGSAKVDPASPVAAEVARATRSARAYPRFSDIPPVPGDLRPLPLYGQAADELKLARARLERETAPETWTLRDTETFATRVRRDAGPELEPATPSDAEAYARELRERATPPPPRQ